MSLGPLPCSWKLPAGLRVLAGSPRSGGVTYSKDVIGSCFKKYLDRLKILR